MARSVNKIQLASQAPIVETHLSYQSGFHVVIPTAYSIFPPALRPAILPTTVVVRSKREELAVSRHLTDGVSSLGIHRAVGAVAMLALFGCGPPFPLASDHHQVPPLFERTARFIDDIAQEGEDDAYDSSPQDHDDDEDSHEAMARRLDRRDFGNLEGVSLFDVLPPTPSSGDDSYDWPSRSPSPMHLDAPVHDAPPVGSSALTPEFRPGTPMLETPSRMPSAAPRPRSSSVSAPPPTKRQRTKPSVAATVLRQLRGYFDEEAEDEDEDEDENEDGEDDDFSDLEDFIDDAEPTDDPQIVHKSTAQSLEQEAQELDEVAEYYRARARAETHRTPAVDEDFDGSEHASPSRLPTADDLARAPLYLFFVTRRHEMDLISFLSGYQGISSLFTRGIGSRAVYCEATDIHNVRLAVKEYRKQHGPHVQRSPKEITAMESVLQVILPPVTNHSGKWRRLDRKVGTLLRNDLVFVRDWTFVGIPRVSYHTDDPNSPAPQVLFDLAHRAKFSEEYPSWLSASCGALGVLCWSGLEEHSWESEDIFAKTWSGHGSMYQTADANPTDTELAHFAACDWRGLTGVVHPRQDGTCALQAGDPVVVVAGRHARGRTGRGPLRGERFGEIIGIVEKQVRHRLTQGRFKIRNIPKFEKTTDVLFNETTIVVPVACLRLHFSAIIRNVFIDDRVKVVSGNESRVSGRVEDIDGNIITVRPRESEALLHVELRHINHDFQVSDLVKVVRGIDEGTVGFILGFKIFGHIELFPVSGRPKQQDLEDGGNPVVVPTTHIQFLGVQTLADLDAQTELAERLNRMEVKRKEWKQDLMNTGRGYLGMEVQLVRKTAYKKQYGTVVGFTREKEGGIYKGVKVEVQLEMGHAKIWVGLRNVIERFSGEALPRVRLIKAMEPGEMEEGDDLKGKGRAEVDEGRDPTPVPENPDLSWGINIGVENGTWLLNEKFFNKRIDVTIAGIAQSKFPSLINTRNSHHDGARGFLEPLKEKRAESTLRKKGFGVRLPPFSQMFVFPADAIHPERQTADGKCISTVQGRVLIIGPDVNASWQHLGDYAQTVPGETELPLVKVLFPPLYVGGRNPTGLYNLRCLCQALNEQLRDIPPTNFQMPAR
ncbi:hypothetical protein K438DRAFT_1774105 [Mycena galopus ATCC 62051]|nr:hypothetical protein K438DRAFT_1774105 [Mycena galopus ATCC 62051]